MALELVHSLLGIGTNRLALIGLLDDETASLASLSIHLGLLNHTLDILVDQARWRGNGHGLILVGGRVLGSDVDDTISIDVEGDFDLRDADEVEVAEKLVVPDELTLTLVDFDLDSGLAMVEKVWVFLVGMVVLRGMSLVMIPPKVSIPGFTM